MKPDLTIIIPAFNCASTLEEAVSSCFDQGLKEAGIGFEIVIVDDASTDRTADTMKKIATEHSEVKLFSHETNKGGGATRNTAVGNASADVIFCLDSDDILPKGTLAKMYGFMQEKKKSGLKCDGVGVHRSLKFKGAFRGLDHIERVDTFAYAGEKVPFESLLQKDGKLCPLYSVFMHTKDAFVTAGGYPEDHGFDTQAFAWRFLANGLVAYTCPDAEYLHRLHARGLYASYYTREARAGRTNRNWFLIFAQFFYLFDAEVKRYILGFDLNREDDLFDAVAKGFDPVFVRGYELLIKPYNPVSLAKLYSATEITLIQKKIDTPLLPVSFSTRVVRKLKKVTRPTRLFLYDIRTRLGKRHQISLVFNYIGLVLNQARRVDFAEDCSAVKGGKGTGEKIDIVIPTVSKDRVLLKEMIKSIKQNLCNAIGDIYIVSYANDDLIAFCKEEGYTFIEEKSLLGYGKEKITYTANGVDRSGWLFQQLLKWSGEKFVKARRYLIVDSDTVLIHQHAFLEGENGDKVVFRYNTEWHEPYFKSFQVLFGYEAPTRLSFTSHMMLFDTVYLVAIKKEIETKKGKSWDQAYIDLADSREASAMSDYDLYANWVLYNHPDKVVTRPLYNTGLPRKDFDSLEKLAEKYGAKYKTLSFHSWIR